MRRGRRVRGPSTRRGGRKGWAGGGFGWPKGEKRGRQGRQDHRLTSPLCYATPRLTMHRISDCIDPPSLVPRPLLTPREKETEGGGGGQGVAETPHILVGVPLPGSLTPARFETCERLLIRSSRPARADTRPPTIANLPPTDRDDGWINRNIDARIPSTVWLIDRRNFSF